MSKKKNYTVSASQFDEFIVSTTKKIIASNNDLKTLQNAKKLYKKMKQKISPANLMKIHYDFNKILELGFEAVAERKKEPICPF